MSFPVLSTSRRRAFFLAPILAAGLSLLSCGREITGPEGRVREAAFAFDPRMPKAFAVEGSGSVVPFNRVRVTLTHLDGALAGEKLVDFPADAPSVELAVSVLLPFGSGNEGIDLILRMQYINAAGDTVFRAGPQTVTAVPISAGEPQPVVPVEVTYVGPGADATTVVISQPSGTVLAGTSTTFSATAHDAQEATIANTPVVFSSPDAAHVTITPQGVATWLPVRGPARIVATLPTGVDADTLTMTVTLPATQLEIVSGNGQSGGAGQPLENDIMLRVLAADDVPVAGVVVTFAVATGGGALTELTATSDADGLVATEWTLGGAPGVQTLTATFPGLIGGPVTISANSGAGAATALTIASGDGQQGTPGQPLPLPLVVRVTDAFGNGVAGVTVEFNVLAGGGSTAPTVATTDATGHASSQWTLGATLGVQQLEAYAPSIDDAAPFTATAASSGIATWTGAVDGDWNVAGNWDIGAVPAATDHVVIPNVGANPYPRLTASPTLVGSVDVAAGTLWLNNQQMVVSGDFSTTGSGVLVMQEEGAQLFVGGNASFGGGSSSGLLTLGALSVAGNFTQDGTNSPESFQAGPGFTTVLQSPTPTVSFTHPGSSGATSRFGDLIWSGNGTLTQQSGISVIGAYGSTSPTPVTHLGIGGTAGRYLEFRTFVSFGPIVFDNVRLFLQQDAAAEPEPVSIANITFQNLPSAATQLAVTHPGGGADVSIDNVTFQQVPATGMMLQANDNNTGDGAPLVVNVANATPVTAPGTGGSLSLNGAVINWPAASQRTWLGTTSNQWEDASNWFPAAVPGALDEVLITPASNAPVLSSAATIGNLVVATGATLTLNASILTVQGDIAVDGAVVADPLSSGFRAAGTGRTIRGTGIQHVDVRGIYTLSGALTITDALFVRGSINPDANSLTIGGNLSLLSAGVLIMQSPEDFVSVGGNAFFTGGATQGLLTNGTLELHGNLVQANSGTGNPANSFGPSPTHVTRLVGSGLQDIDIFNTGRGAGFSHFGTLDLTGQTGTVNFSRFNTVFVDGDLISNGAGLGALITTDNNARLDAADVAVTRLRVQGLPLTIGSTGGGVLSGVTFDGFLSNVTQLTVTSAGSAEPVVLSGLTFNVQPTTGSYYVEANDADGATPDALTVHVIASSPAAPSPTLFNATNGAVIGWPPAAGARIWTGAASASWSDAANWSGSILPTATDSVHIPSGTPNAPFVDLIDSVRTLTVAAGATMTPGFDLFVLGSVDVAPGGAIQQSDGRLMLASETGGTLSGQLPQVRIEGGLYTLDGDVVIDGNLDIFGQEFTPGVPVLGDVSVGNFNLTVTGGLFTGQQGRFTMMGTGLADVGGYVNFFGASTTGRLTNGTLRVGGEFYQDGGESPTSFAASGAHLVQFVASDRIFFTDPSQSQFQDVDFATAGIARTLESDVNASGLLRIPAANVTLASDAGAGAGNSRRVTAGRAETFGVGITIRNVGITTAAFTSQFGGSVTFTDFDPAIVQLDIQGTSSLLNSALNNTSFATTPTGAGRWVRIADLTPTGGDGSPSLTVVNPTPAAHGGWAEAVAPATMTGWPQSPAVIWQGSVNGDWSTPDNWSSGTLPTATDSVIIPDFPVNAPTFPGGTLQLRALLIEYTGFLNLNSQLTITGTLVAPTTGQFSCDGGSIIFAGGAVDPVRARGTVSCLTRITTGALIPLGNFRVASNDLQVEGDGRLFPGRLTVTIDGNFSTMNGGTLQMTETLDSLIVLGGVTFGGGSTANILTSGVLVVNGNFEQRGPAFDANAASFSASDNHLTVFTGFANPQQVSFETPGRGTGASHFAHVELAKGEPGTAVQLNSPVIAQGQVRAAGTIAQAITSQRGDGSESLESWGADVDLLTFNNVTWSITDGAAIGRMDRITFQAMDLAATQLNIERAADNLTIRQITFVTTPEQGLYMRVADTNTGDGTDLLVTLDTPSPGVHNGRILEEFGARILGWIAG